MKVLSACRAKIAGAASAAGGSSPAFFFPPSQSHFALCKCGHKRWRAFSNNERPEFCLPLSAREIDCIAWAR